MYLSKILDIYTNLNGINDTTRLKITKTNMSLNTTKVSNSEQSRFLKSTVDHKSEIRLQNTGGLAKPTQAACNQ